MKKDDKLRENYEDAYFALVMNEIAKIKGAELLERNEQLKHDPDAAVPEEVTRRSLEAIRREIARQKRRKNAKAAGKIFTRIACAAMLAALMLVTAYAAFPDFRTAALNLLVEHTELRTVLTMVEEKEPEAKEPEAEGRDGMVIFGYQIPEMPEGFTLSDSWEGEKNAWIKYKSADNKIIKIAFYKGTGHSVAIDTEDSATYPIRIQGYDGIYSTENEVMQISWSDTVTNTIISVSETGIEQMFLEELCGKIIPAVE